MRALVSKDSEKLDGPEMRMGRLAIPLRADPFDFDALSSLTAPAGLQPRDRHHVAKRGHATDNGVGASPLSHPIHRVPVPQSPVGQRRS